MNDLLHHLPASAPMQFTRIGELILRDPDWLVRGLIETDSLVLVIGDPSAGKSFLALSVAACVATGTPWNGFRIKPGPVLYIAGEGLSGLARRRTAWELHYGISLTDAPLFVSTSSTGLTDIGAQKSMWDEVSRFQETHNAPALIVVDTLARNFGPGDENNTADMNCAVTSLDHLRRLTGAAMMVVHHTGHVDKGRARGSTVLRAAADTEILLKRDKDGIILGSVLKMKDAPIPPSMTFRLEEVHLGVNDAEGDPVMSAALVPTKEKPVCREVGRGANQKLAVECLRELGSPVAIEEWQRACVARGMKNRSRFWETKQSLSEAGTIRLDREVVWLCELFETVRTEQDSNGRTAASEPFENVRIAPDSNARGACDPFDPPLKGDRTVARLHVGALAASPRPWDRSLWNRVVPRSDEDVTCLAVKEGRA